MGIKYGGTAVDYEALAATNDTGGPLEPDQITKARLTVAHWVADNSGDPTVCDELLQMLGIHPSQDPAAELKSQGPNHVHLPSHRK